MDIFKKIMAMMIILVDRNNKTFYLQTGVTNSIHTSSIQAVLECNCIFLAAKQLKGAVSKTKPLYRLLIQHCIVCLVHSQC